MVQLVEELLRNMDDKRLFVGHGRLRDFFLNCF